MLQLREIEAVLRLVVEQHNARDLKARGVDGQDRMLIRRVRASWSQLQRDIATPSEPRQLAVCNRDCVPARQYRTT